MKTSIASKWLTVKQVAFELGVSTNYLKRHRATHEAPPVYHIGTRYLYDPDELKAWLQARKLNP